jgi:hypothetical protein
MRRYQTLQPSEGKIRLGLPLLTLSTIIKGRHDPPTLSCLRMESSVDSLWVCVGGEAGINSTQTRARQEIRDGGGALNKYFATLYIRRE